MKVKILFLKSLVTQLQPTENLALEILKNPKYDNHLLINKDAIEKAFKEYGEKLNPLNSEIIPAMTDININIEGNFIAKNIPEIPSVVVNKICTKNILYETLDKYDDITHIGLSTYAMGLDNTIEIIKTIQNDFPHIELILGGIGTVYSQIQKLIPLKNICIGEGVNFLRKKFNLKLLLRNEYKIPKIFGYISNVPISIKTAYMITQLGCPNGCNFCITTNFFQYFPFSNYKKIIKFIEDLSIKSHKDVFIYLCDANGFYPESQWKKVFDYFIENPKNIDNNIFISVLASLNHINRFDLETIQKKSPIKIFLVNYGIESTLQGGYLKNKGNYEGVIKRLNKNGIITFHTCILGLPIHTKKNIHIDIKNNCSLKSDVISFNTFKPIPMTPLYNQLKSEGRIYGEELPPELLYFEGFMPFKHPYLGSGFDILPYAFKAYYESEKSLIDVYNNFANKFIDIFALTNSRKIRRAINTFLEISKKNFDSYQLRMPTNLSETYKTRFNNTINRISNL
ncbi:MAG: hypothetical protein ACFFAO_17575 [Candidatus Hermodarchaeota archaeon]